MATQALCDTIIDIVEFELALEKASSDQKYAAALEKLMSEPVERVLYPKTHWVSTSGTFELRVTLHAGDGYREFMAALGT